MGVTKSSLNCVFRPSKSPTCETLYSNLLKSLCPVTGQPDWATLFLHYNSSSKYLTNIFPCNCLKGWHTILYWNTYAPTVCTSLLTLKIIVTRNSSDFHEICVERIFHDCYEALSQIGEVQDLVV